MATGGYRVAPSSFKNWCVGDKVLATLSVRSLFGSRGSLQSHAGVDGEASSQNRNLDARLKGSSFPSSTPSQPQHGATPAIKAAKPHFVPHRPGALEPHPHRRAHNSKIRQQKSTSTGNSQILTTSLTFLNHSPPPGLTTQAKWYEAIQRLNRTRPFANATMNRLRRHKTPCASFASRSSSSTSRSASLVTD